MGVKFEKQYDVVVAGGGMAGVAAALAAAEEGAKVALVEKTVFFGGLATTGLVYAYLQICDGRGTQVSYGLVERLLHASCRYGPNTLRKKDWGKAPWKEGDGRYSTCFSPASMILALDELLLEKGVDCWVDTLLCAAETDSAGRVAAIEVENKSGRGMLRAHAFVDATGDADLVRRAGGRTVDGMNHTCIWAMHHDPSAPVGNFEKRFPLWYYWKKSKDTHGVSGSEVTNFILQSRALLRDFYKGEYAKGEATPDTLYPLVLPAMPQYRTISHIDARTWMMPGQAATRFEDSVGIAADWRGDGRNPVWEMPYSSLVPKDVGGVLAAGRCTAAEDEAWEISRVIPAAVITGEAAGVASALAVRGGLAVEDVSAADVQARLVQRGVRLHLPDVGLAYR